MLFQPCKQPCNRPEEGKDADDDAPDLQGETEEGPMDCGQRRAHDILVGWPNNWNQPVLYVHKWLLILPALNLDQSKSTRSKIELYFLSGTHQMPLNCTSTRTFVFAKLQFPGLKILGQNTLCFHWPIVLTKYRTNRIAISNVLEIQQQ